MPVIDTYRGKTFKARADSSAGAAQNSTDATFPSKVDTATEPTGVGVIDLTPGTSNITSNGIRIGPYGSGNNNTTFSMRVIGWERVESNPYDANKTIWHPEPLCELLCTLSNAVGVAGRAIVATERYADTIVVTTGSTGVTLDVVSGWTDVAAHALIDLIGHGKIEIIFSTGSSATDMNCLVSKI